MWRMTKAIIVSWIVGVVCGIGMVLVMQSKPSTPPVSNTSIQTAPQTSGDAPSSPDQIGQRPQRTKPVLSV
jgi:hypothetical protein